MPDIQIIKLKIRRGSDAQRKTVLLEQGELGYTIDTKRLFVGDGTTIGGTPAGTVSHLPRLTPGSRTSLIAERGDIVYDTSVLFQLTGTDSTQLSAWARIGTVTDNSTIEYSGSNVLQIKNNGITGNKFNPNAVAPSGGLRVNPTLGLSANVDTQFIVISGNNVITLSAFNSNQVISSSLGNGLIGGNGTQMSVDADPQQFGYVSNTLTLTAIGNNVIDVNSLSADIIGDGLQIVGDKIESVLQTVDNITIRNDNGVIRMVDLVAGSTAFEDITYDIYGRVIGTTSTIVDALSVNINETGHADALSGENWYKGYYYDSEEGNRSLIYAISSGDDSNETVTLSSAGFIQLNVGDDTPGNRLAIPAYIF
jgi:hypothetical protein